jgi:hypothetical protein
MSRKKSIAKPIRRAVWETWAGKDSGIFNCGSCWTKISVWDFECGHIKSEKDGGSTTIDNLIPICKTCNQSMRTINVDEFRKKMKESGVIRLNEQLNLDCSTNQNYIPLEVKFNIESLKCSELKSLCELYGVSKGSNKKEHIASIISSPKYNINTIQQMINLKKILLTVKSEILMNICDTIGLSKIGSDSQLITSVVSTYPKFDYIDYILRTNNTKKTPKKQSKAIVVSNDQKDELIIINGFTITFIPFSKNNDEKAIIMAKKDNSVWRSSYTPTDLKFITIESFDKSVHSYLMKNNGKSGTFVYSDDTIDINIEDTDNVNIKVTLKKDLIDNNESKRKINDLHNAKVTIDPCKCKHCDERLTRLEKIINGLNINQSKQYHC